MVIQEYYICIAIQRIDLPTCMLQQLSEELKFNYHMLQLYICMNITGQPKNTYAHG